MVECSTARRGHLYGFSQVNTKAGLAAPERWLNLTTLSKHNQTNMRQPAQIPRIAKWHRTCIGQSLAAEGFYIMNSRQKWLLTLALTCTLIGALPGRAQENGPPEPSASGWRKFGETRTSSELPQPAELTAVAGTWVTIRVDQPLSSDHNQPGDAFTGTLTQPLVVNGVVIARRGQTVGGPSGGSAEGRPDQGNFTAGPGGHGD